MSTWIPRHSERSAQCASCPFAHGNDLEFLEVVNKLRQSAGMRPGKLIDAAFARYQIAEQVKHAGDFACHHTVYDDAMRVKPTTEHRQCPGATAFHNKQRAKGGRP